MFKNIALFFKKYPLPFSFILVILIFLGYWIQTSYGVHKDGIVSVPIFHLTFMHLSIISILILLVLTIFYAIFKINKLYENCSDQKIFYETMLDNLSVPISYKDINGIYKYANAKFMLTAEKLSKEIIGKHTREVFNRLPKEEVDRLIAAEIKVIRENKDQAVIVHFNNASGLLQNIIFNKAPYINKSGGMEGIIATGFNVEDIKILKESFKK